MCQRNQLIVCILGLISSVSPETTTVTATVDGTSDSLSPAKMMLLRDLEPQNERRPQLTREVEIHRPVTRAPQPRRIQSWLQCSSTRRGSELPNLLSSENSRSQLEAEKKRLLLKLFMMEASPNVLGYHNQNQFTAGPCNTQVDGSVAPGISKRMFVAGYEASKENACNQILETRREIERITEEIDRLSIEMQCSACTNPSGLNLENEDLQ
ncbi:hypothetical protein QAD02_018918 [Eretmocerus hayati]|uniref:Uncharacterized protein n=1 Tax=Eretmocerus hayati TaxID=131215 RepID=A0ACC2PJX1_9HYME|nr:hypothetical protein QAD02_018918 [Eretmocerus hayati]